MVNIYHSISFVLPKKLRKNAINSLSYVGFKKRPERVLGMLMLNGSLMSTLIALTVAHFTTFNIIVTFLFSFFAIFGFVYFSLILLIDKKTKVVEQFLPDALGLMASNLRAGMTPDKALILAAQPEFGLLKEEIDRVGKQVSLGKNIGGALNEMAERIRSKRLTRAITLINSGLDSGGSLVNLIEETASHLEDQSLVDKKIRASISMYVIFIFSATAFIAPMMFGMSTFLVKVLRQNFANIDIPSTATTALPINITEVSITTQFLTFFIIAFITSSLFMGSMVVGLIGKGNQKEGLRYFIPMMMVAIPVYFASRLLIEFVFGGLFNF